MTRSKRVPKYRKQSRPSGNLGFVELDGRRIYLGRYGTPESKAAYARVVAEWSANAGRLRVTDDDLTIVELCDAFQAHCESYYPAESKEPAHFRVVMGALRRLYGRARAAEFGPLAFKAVRQELQKTPQQRGDKASRKRGRRYLNALGGRMRHIFKWGVAEELVPPGVYQALLTVPGLKRGRTDAPESEPVVPVADSVVDATCKHLTPTLVAMVRLQQYTGMRPGEVCAMRTCDVRTDGTVWTYQPAEHKTAYRGRSRTVFIGPRAQAVLKRWLRKDLEAFLFSPVESERSRREAKHKERKTPPSCGNRPGSNRVRRPRRPAGDRYNTASYGRAIQYGCRKAFGQDRSLWWGVNRLRHSFATMVRSEHGLEAAQVLLGHAAADVTQMYAERDTATALRVVAKIG